MSVRRLILVLGLLGQMLAGPVSAAGVQQENAQLQAALKAEEDGANDMAALEPAVVRASAGRAVRNGDRLTLRLTDRARPLILTDDNTCESDNSEDACKIFHLVADLKTRHAYVVHIAYYEGDEVWWIDDRTGEKTSLPSIPQFGPDGRTFITLDNDVAYGDSGIDIWRRTPHGVSRVFHQQYPEGMQTAKVARWTSPDLIVLGLSPLAEINQPAPTRTMNLRHRSDRWNLDEEMKPDAHP